MKRFISRLCCLGFVGLFSAVTFNALYLQEEGKKAHASANRNISTAALRSKKPHQERREVRLSAKKKPSSSSQKIASRKKPSKGLVRAIQRELKARRYHPGGTDGIAGIMTTAAIMAYEHDNNLPLSGEVSEVLLKRMLLGPTRASKENGPRKGNSLRAIHTTKAVQTVLGSLGYSPGLIDGMAGRETRKAIRSFEKDRGLKQTGRVSGRLVKEIRRVTGEDLTV